MAAIAIPLAGCGSDPGGDPESPESPKSLGPAAERPAGDGAASGPPQPPAQTAARKPADPLAGAERLLFIGDSLGIAGELPYPSRIGGLLGRPVEVTNLSQAGTTSGDWLPGGALFAGSLRPALAGADAVFVSIGGNDLEQAILGPDGLDGPDALERARETGALGALGVAFERIGRNLGRTFSAIEEANPKATIVFVGYPDYSSSAVWQERGGAVGAIALRAGLEAFGALADNAGADETIDMLEATSPEIDSLLSDGEHLSDAGHQLYAERIAERLEP